MIRRPTALIVGAGASMEYGFPSGTRLRQEIVSGIRAKGTTSADLYGLLNQLENGTERARDATLQEFADELEDSGLPSVDLFLDHRPEFGMTGRRAIAATLMRYEVEQKLRDRSAEPRWYENLWMRMVEGAPTEQIFGGNELAVVTFNYDRSLEAFLHRAMRTTFPNSVERVWPDSVPIVHVHGSLGDYCPGKTGHREYTNDFDLNELRAAADKIRLVGDTATQRAIAAASRIVERAERIVFLGFGYLQDNLSKLESALASRDKDIFGTGVGLGMAVRDGIVRQLREGRTARNGNHGIVQIDDGGRGALRYLEHAGCLI